MNGKPLPLPPIFAHSDISVPPFFPWDHPSTKWLLNTLRNGAIHRLVAMIKEKPNLFSQLFQIVDCPDLVLTNRQDIQSMFSRRTILYLRPLSLAIYMKKQRAIQVLLNSNASNQNKVNYATDVFSQSFGVHCIDILELLPVCIAIRRGYFEALPLLFSGLRSINGSKFDARSSFSLQYLRPTLCKTLTYLDSLHYATEIAKRSGHLPLVNLLEIFITQCPGFYSYSSLTEIDGITLFRRLARLAVYEDNESRLIFQIIQCMELLLRTSHFNPEGASSNMYLASRQSRLVCEDIAKVRALWDQLDEWSRDCYISIGLLFKLYALLLSRVKNGSLIHLGELLTCVLIETGSLDGVLDQPIGHLSDLLDFLLQQDDGGILITPDSDNSQRGRSTRNRSWGDVASGEMRCNKGYNLQCPKDAEVSWEGTLSLILANVMAVLEMQHEKQLRPMPRSRVFVARSDNEDACLETKGSATWPGLVVRGKGFEESISILDTLGVNVSRPNCSGRSIMMSRSTSGDSCSSGFSMIQRSYTKQIASEPILLYYSQIGSPNSLNPVLRRIMPATQLKSRSHSLKHVRLHHKSNATERESLGMSTKFHGLKAIAKERNITCSRPRSRAHSYQGFQDPNLPPILLAQSENKLGKTTKIDTLLSENIPIRSQSLATSSLLSQINHRPVKRSSSNSTDCKHIAVQPGKEVVCDAYVEEPIRAQRFSIHSSQSRPCPSLPASQYISYIPRRTMPQRQSTFEVYSSSPLGQERPALGKERRLGSLIANTKADKKEERLFTSGESDLSRIPHLSLCDMDQLVQQITDSTLSYDRGEKMKDELDKQLLDDMIHEYSVPNPSELPRFSIRLKKNKRDSSSKSKSLCFDNEPATRQAEEIQQQKSECQPQLSNRWNKMRRSRSVHISEYQHQLPQDASPEKLPASLQSSQLSLNQITLKQQMQVAKQMEEKEQQPSASPQEMSQSHLLQSQKSEQKYPIRRECWVPNTSSLLRLGPYMERLPGISPIQEPVSRAIRQYWDDFGPHVLIDNQDDKNQPSSVYQNRSPRSWQHARVDLRSPSCRLSETGYSVCLPFYQQALACKEVLYIPDTCYLANQSEMPNNLDAKEEAKHVLLATPNCNSNQQRHTYLVSCPTKPHQETSKHSRPMSRLHLKEALPSVESGYITPHHYHCLPVYPDQSDL